MSPNIFPGWGGGGWGGETPYKGGGLHLTCDTHFQIRMSYSSQKSYVKIWFGVVEIRGMLMLREAEDLLLGVWGGGGLHVTCDAHFRT